MRSGRTALLLAMRAVSLANQIQLLALRNQELEVENRRLRDRQAGDEPAVTRLEGRR